MLAVEIVRAAWRFHRCAVAEAEDGENPATQASVDRALTWAHNSLRSLLNDLRQFQSDRWLRAEVLREGFDEAYIGIADAHRVIKGLANDSRLKSQTIQTQLMGQASPAPVVSPVAPAVSAAGERPAPTNRTQLVGQALSPGNPDQHPSRDREGAVPPAVAAPVPIRSTAPETPRNAPCPCNSGLKYKRCCGVAAPPVLGAAARP